MDNEIWPGVRHYWTDDERHRQLRDLEALSDLLAKLLDANHDPREAEPFRACAHQARSLLAQGFTQAGLNDLGYAYPDGPWWLNTKASDYASREPWQDEVAEVHAQASEAARNIRSIGTTHHP